METEGVAVRVAVESCRREYNTGKRLDIFKLDFELEVVIVSAMELTELSGETLV
jgi:hypothetical protein